MRLTLGIILSLSAALVYAEQADRSLPINLEADQVILDDIKKISTFSGNVILSQGTMLMRADKVVVTLDKDGFSKGILYGNPASYRQKREGMDEYIEASAERVEYDARAETLNFYGQAKIKRSLDFIEGEHISYQAKTEIFQVDGRAEKSGVPAKRVRAVLQPQSLRKN